MRSNNKYNGVLSFESLAFSLGREIDAEAHITIIGDPVGERLRYFGVNGGLFFKFLLPKIVTFMEKSFWRMEVEAYSCKRWGGRLKKF